MGCSNAKQQQAKEPKPAPVTLLAPSADMGKKEESPVEETHKLPVAEPAEPPAGAADAESKTYSPAVPLKITFISARGLRNADWLGKSDPYVTCQVPDKEKTMIQSKVIKQQLDPEWNEEVEMPDYCVGESLCFVVKDQDPLKPDDLLGKVTLKPDQFYDSGFEGEVELTEAGDKTGQAFLKIKIDVMHPKVTLTVVSARALRNADWVGKSDPYCIVEVPGRNGAGFKTPVVRESLNPEWNHEAVLFGYRANDPIHITVMDKDKFTSDDFLGSITLLPEQFWKEGLDGEKQLEKTGHSGESFLKLKIKISQEALAPEIGMVDDKAAPTGMCGFYLRPFDLP